jgi:hypothetical protein
MTATTEQKLEYTYTAPNGATVIVANVPGTLWTDTNGGQHKRFSFKVALRLETLRNDALERDHSPNAVHRLEF